MIDPEQFEEFNDNLDNLVAIVSGYKNKLLAAGFDDEDSSYMAVEFHRVLMANQMANIDE